MTVSSLLSMTLFNCIAILFIQLIITNNKILLKVGFPIFIYIEYAIILRFLLPVEFPFMKALPIKNYWPSIYIYFTDTNIPLYKYKISIFTCLAAVWIVGIILFGAKEIKNYIKLLMFRKSCSPVKNTIINNFLKKSVSQYKKDRSFGLIKTDQNIAPVIFGIKNPCIIIPDINLEYKYWKYILEHEVAHFYHRDLYLKLLSEIVSILYWWNPFAYMLKKQIKRLLELNIDSKVTASFTDNQKIEYLECLLTITKVCNIQKFESSFSASILNFSPSTFKQRFELICKDLDGEKKTIPQLLVILICSFVLIISVSFGIIMEPYGIKPQDQAESFDLTIDNCYFIKTPEGSYDVYYNNNYFGTVKKIFDSNIKIYSNIKEVPNYEAY